MSLFSKFPRTFWVANVMELFERAAYYGMNSVLAIYLTDQVADGGLGFSEGSVGFLQAIVYAATYVIPILGGALADRYGYRRMLMIAFTLLSVGYFVSGQMRVFPAVFAALLFMAVGAGLFKPIISGTIARTTTPETSSFGFGVYYWMINLGAFIAPILVTWYKGLGWKWVFVASACYVAAMIPLTLFVYRDPVTPQGGKSLAEVARAALTVLGDARFMLMIVAYSGFWVLYFQNFGTVLWYLRDFVDTAPVDRFVNSVNFGLFDFRLDAEYVTVINAGTIILLQFLISRWVKDRPALATMITGMAIGTLGFLALAASTNAWIFVLGIAVFSIGEMTAHPKYYSYVGMVAPQDRKAVYMGYAFLYGVFGSLIGSNLGGFLYERMLKPVIGTPEGPGRTHLFWLIFAALNLVAMVGLWLFSRAYGEDTPASRAGARRAMRIVYSLILALGAAAAGYGSGVFGGGALQPKTVLQGAIFVLLGGFGLWVTARGGHSLDQSTS